MGNKATREISTGVRTGVCIRKMYSESNRNKQGRVTSYFSCRYTLHLQLLFEEFFLIKFFTSMSWRSRLESAWRLKKWKKIFKTSLLNIRKIQFLYKFQRWKERGSSFVFANIVLDMSYRAISSIEFIATVRAFKYDWCLLFTRFLDWNQKTNEFVDLKIQFFEKDLPRFVLLTWLKPGGSISITITDFGGS